MLNCNFIPTEQLSILPPTPTPPLRPPGNHYLLLYGKHTPEIPVGMLLGWPPPPPPPRAMQRGCLLSNSPGSPSVTLTAQSMFFDHVYTFLNFPCISQYSFFQVSVSSMAYIFFIQTKLHWIVWWSLHWGKRVEWVKEKKGPMIGKWATDSWVFYIKLGALQCLWGILDCLWHHLFVILAPTSHHV